MGARMENGTGMHDRRGGLARALRRGERAGVGGPGIGAVCLGAMLSAVALAMPPSVQAQAQAQTQTRGGPGPSLYAVNAASLSAAMTYCMTKYGPLRVGSRGESCFVRARQALAGYGLADHARKIDAACNDPARFNTCITPEIGKLVMALNALFDEQRL